MLEKIEHVTTDVIVAEKLKRWIIEKNLQPGDKLPTELQLCEELGVARHTLREGIKRLSQAGIVASRTGAGIYICEVNFDNFAEYMFFLEQKGYISLADVVSIRIILECNVVKELAKIITDEQLNSLREYVQKMDAMRKENDFTGYINLDIAFHLSMANYINNKLLSGILEAMRKVITGLMSSLDSETMQLSNDMHTKLVKALTLHDSDMAEKVMREHLTNVEKNIY